MAAHLDPSVLQHQEPTHPGDIPSLGIDPNAQIRATPISTTGSLNPQNQNPISLGNPQAEHKLNSTPAASAQSVAEGNLYSSSNPPVAAASMAKTNDGVAPSTKDLIGDHDPSAINRSKDGAPNAKQAPGSAGGQTGYHDLDHAKNNAPNTGTSTGTSATSATTGKVDSATKSAQGAATSTLGSAKATAANLKDNLPTTTGVRQRVNVLSDQIGSAAHQAADHPVVKDAKDVATKQVGQFREFLGNFPIVKDLEKQTGVDRVVLVTGGIVGYLILVPLNLFGLALPVTQFLTFVPPAYLALDILDRSGSHANEEPTKALLAYFVVLGLIQLTESFAYNVLSRRIPQYWTVKLLFLAWLLHPQTMGALKIHNNILRNFVPGQARQTTTTPPTSKPSTSQHSSPTFPAANIPKVAARGEGFEVISERM